MTQRAPLEGSSDPRTDLADEALVAAQTNHFPLVASQFARKDRAGLMFGASIALLLGSATLFAMSSMVLFALVMRRPGWGSGVSPERWVVLGGLVLPAVVLLPLIAYALIAGERLMVLAHGERGGRFDLDRVNTSAKPAPDGWVLSGAKSQVLGGGGSFHCASQQMPL